MTKRIGAFWKKVLPDGRVVYGGYIDVDGKKIRINLWETDMMGVSKRPDLIAVLDTFDPNQKAL